MARLKLYRKHGKKYKTELRPSRIDILILPLLVCFLASIVLWCYVTGHNRPETETEPPAAETTAPAEEPTEEEGETEARPAEV
jgi:hypothetical protein